MNNFTPSSFKNFQNKSKNVKQNMIDIKVQETGFSELAVKIIEYWNSKGIKKHQIKKTKILKRFDSIISNGVKTAPSLFSFDNIKDVIDIYEKHLKTGYSRMSIGDGAVFKFSIDEFFKFSKFQRDRIDRSKTLEILKGKRSLFYSLYKNQEEFYWEQKKPREEFSILYSNIIMNLNRMCIIDINENDIPEDLKKWSKFSLQKCFDENKNKLIFYEGVVSNFEIQNCHLFYNTEMFFKWIMNFINEKLSQNFNEKYLNAKWFYKSFIKHMYSIGRGI